MLAGGTVLQLSVNLQEKNYDIIIEHGVLNRIGDFADLNRKVLIISDTGAVSYTHLVLLFRILWQHMREFERDIGIIVQSIDGLPWYLQRLKSVS